MATSTYIPQSPALRAEQVRSWASQLAMWGHAVTPKSIDSHYSANAVYLAVDDEEKPLILKAWADGYKHGTSYR